MRRATQQDEPALKAFLERHLETSMFLLGNLETHGAESTNHDHSTGFFLREEAGQITGVFGCTRNGYLLCQMPGLTLAEAQGIARKFAGYTMLGITGDAEQIATMLVALPVPQTAWQLNRVEPLYQLDLIELPASQADLRAPSDPDMRYLPNWFEAYMRETGTQAVDDPRARAEKSLDAPYVRIMFEGDAPLAMTAINAKAGSAVQIGGVFVPPENRGRGLAGQIIAAHLNSLRSEGVSKAILFAASPDAARAYEKIGFQRIGDYRIAMLTEPFTLEFAG
ncbi:MAG: GNAT family N-acetyltransferase [Pelagimonas sp.]